MGHHSSSKSHHSGKTSGSHTGSSKHAHSSDSFGSPRHRNPECSFLFVVNEFKLGDYEASIDSWGNQGPPTQSRFYTGETVSHVFRYDNGRVRPDPRFLWYRPHGWGAAGGIMYQDQSGIWLSTQPYSQASVFSCSALLPVVVAEGDASLGGTHIRFAGSTNTSPNPNAVQGQEWNMLSFQEKGGDLVGVSFVSNRSMGRPRALGKDATWIPALVPRAFANTGRAPGSNIASRGLGGELGIVLGLIAFQSEQQCASEAFGKTRDGSRYKWDAGRWNGSERAPVNTPVADADMAARGFLVHISLDPLNRYSTKEHLTALEQFGVLVEG